MDNSLLNNTTHNSLILMATDCTIIEGTHHQAEVQSIRWVFSLDKHLKGRQDYVYCILIGDKKVREFNSTRYMHSNVLTLVYM